MKPDELTFASVLTLGLPPLSTAKARGPEMLFLYVFRCDRFHKIGISASPRNRLAMLQNGNPFPIDPVGYRRVRRDRAKAFEGLIHVVLKDLWHRNEWFDAPEARIASAITNAHGTLGEFGLNVARKIVYDHSPVLRGANPDLPMSRMSRGLQ